MEYEWKVFDTGSGWTGTYSMKIEEFLNDPSNYEGWEFVQVVGVYTGGANLLFRRLKKE